MDLDSVVSHQAFWPVIVFLILGISFRAIAFTSPKNEGAKQTPAFVLSMCMMALWALIIYYVCTAFGTNWGWFLVLFPYVFYGIYISLLTTYNPTCVAQSLSACAN